MVGQLIANLPGGKDIYSDGALYVARLAIGILQAYSERPISIDT